ncbi:MAG: sugar transferase [Clostridiales bacterium]|nr:sugar transferase [Clostridiales bacterium]
MYRNFLKRVLAVILSMGGIICLSWLLLLICAAIKIDDPGPVLFKQKRVGKNKEYFHILKFRSMKTATPHDMPTHLLEDPDQYITLVGRFLRKTSLDELPQLFNILAGDMAVVGPRPALWNQYDLIEERDKYGANDVRPGLTGWAQIHGRDELEIEEKAKLDGYYVNHLSFPLDVKCFMGTIVSVIKKDGVVEGGTGAIHAQDEK